MNYIDLSHPIFHGMPTYPSDPDVCFEEVKNIENNRTLLHQFSIGTHTGTHLDVPAHIIKGGKTLEDFPLSTFSGIAVKVNINEYSEIKNIDKQIDGIILDTGWYKNFNNPAIYFGPGRPQIPFELIELLLLNKLKFFGCDLPSVDVSGMEDKPIHHALLEANIIIYESLANLGELSFFKPFNFYGFPLSLVGLDGSPVRAVAENII